ncbi:MAG: phosphoribosylamine--glycine ligase [Propionibacteriaceae bacterium]|nr:phosphoribosylamine--glycine ligase [Propionibacteriaceae bacterium]
MTGLRVLVVGSGGREHALQLAFARDPAVAAAHVAPGNPGTWRLSQSQDSPAGPSQLPLADLDPLDGAAVVALARRLEASLVVIGPEAPLVAGLADEVRAAGLACFGPSAAAAQLEGSKQFAKEVMAEAGVPTAASFYCTTAEQVVAALDEFGPPYVVKNDGLAAGKGVLVTGDRQAARAHAADCGAVVIEEFLDGPEVSLFALTDGTSATPLLPAQDFKRAGDGGQGPNTGGMGAYTPLPWAPDNLASEVMTRVIEPTVAQMARRGTPFSGLLYAGLALTSRGLRVVEFNVRFGDPETQAILPLLETGLGEVLLAAATGRLDTLGPLAWRPGASLAVVMAAAGYPGPPRQGGRIEGPGLFEPVDGVQIVHAGTALDSAGRLVAAGGRVLDVVAGGADLQAARRRAYAAIEQLNFPTGFCRHDIAQLAAEGQIGPVAPL